MLAQLEKYKRADFGRCPRVLCQSQPLLPVGLTDVPYEKSVKLYCGRCEDIYSPKSSRHGSIDGAYFGTSFPHLLFLVYPNLIPPKSGPVELGLPGRSAEVEGSRRSRRMREEQDAQAEGVGEVSTASVALKADRYRPRIFGFQVNEIAKLQRWQEAVRDRCVLVQGISLRRRANVLRSQADFAAGGLGGKCMILFGGAHLYDCLISSFVGFHYHIWAGLVSC